MSCCNNDDENLSEIRDYLKNIAKTIEFMGKEFERFNDTFENYLLFKSEWGFRTSIKTYHGED